MVVARARARAVARVVVRAVARAVPDAGVPLKVCDVHEHEDLAPVRGNGKEVKKGGVR